MPGALPSQTEKRIIAALPLHLPRGSRERTKGKAVWERAVPCGGEGPIRGTSPSPARTCQEYEWTSVPLRRHPRLAGWPSTATPTFLHLPSRWNSGKGRRAPRSQSSGVGSYLGPPEPAGDPQWSGCNRRTSGQLAFFRRVPLSLLFLVRLPHGTPCYPRSRDPELEDDVWKASAPG